jgi:hypothetical protein
MIVKFAKAIGKIHGKFFMWLGQKAEGNPHQADGHVTIQ